MAGARALLPDVTYCADPYEAARGADAIALITEWSAFKTVDLTRVRQQLRQPIVVDGRNVFDPAAMAALGFRYRGIGVQSAAAKVPEDLAVGRRARTPSLADAYDAALLVAADD